jgi:tryptophan synthase alpha chain
MPNRIDAVLGELRESGRTALAPFITVGFPDVPTSEALARTILESGGDMLELGVPFSDPLADGPTVQMTSYRALQNGVTVRECLDVVRRLRAQGVESPLIFLGYYNPYLRYGPERFLDDAAAAGLDGMIVPDLPTEEAAQFGEMAADRGIHLIPMLAPTSSDERIEDACKAAGGFIYCVSLTGVTSARSSLSHATSGLVERIRQHTDLPILVGFGVSRLEHLVEIGTYAEGAAVGSALLDAVDRAPPDGKVDAARDFIHALRGTSTAGGKGGT